MRLGGELIADAADPLWSHDRHGLPVAVNGPRRLAQQCWKREPIVVSVGLDVRIYQQQELIEACRVARAADFVVHPVCGFVEQRRLVGILERLARVELNKAAIYVCSACAAG